ncbi:MAG: hypothetical protein ACREHD_31695, partial [Pirellulales bacterium]
PPLRWRNRKSMPEKLLRSGDFSDLFRDGMNPMGDDRMTLALSLSIMARRAQAPLVAECRELLHPIARRPVLNRAGVV